MEKIYHAILDSFRRGRPVVLATITGQSGSSPRAPGSKLLIGEDGFITGSIGGGILEKSVTDAAAEVLSSQHPLLFKSDPDTTCSGGVEVFLEPLFPADKTSPAIYREITGILRRGGSGIIATVTDEDLWQDNQAPKAFFRASGECTGRLPDMEKIYGDIMDKMPSPVSGQRPSIMALNDRDGKEIHVFIEPVTSDPVLYIFGAGHVSAQVVPLAGRVGFKSIVIDDRPGFATAAGFPDAYRVFCYPYEDVLKNLRVDGASYIVIATRSHECDELVLGQALSTGAGYIGMIGSRRKISHIFDSLINKGFQKKDLNQVHSPIGLEIGAETPEEIALSIVSELVKVRANK